jgi:8-oxo-dGTP pyrophosphatase MutT (NUDIX family)
MSDTLLIDKIALIYIRDRKVLATRSAGKDAWYLPGGKREAGEKDKQTLMREIREELSVDIKPETVKYLGTFQAQAHGKPPGVFVQMTCYTAEFDGELKASQEIAEFDWHDSTVDPTILAPVDKIIYAYLKKENMID